MVMEPVNDFTKVKAIAANRGVYPGKVKGTKDGIQFTNGENPRLDRITWDEFEKILNDKNLAVYASGNWMKIMKKK